MSGVAEAVPAAKNRWQAALSVRGTLSLRAYLRHGTLLSLLALAAGGASFAFLPFAIIGVVAYYLLGVASIKRLRDMDRGWYWLLIVTVPLIGPLLMSLALAGDTAGAAQRPSLFRFPFAATAIFWFQACFFVALFMAAIAESGEGFRFTG